MSKAVRLSTAGALAYRHAGWTITAHGHPDPGTTTGPCTRCRQPCTRYGTAGTSHCPTCQTAEETAA